MRRQSFPARHSAAPPASHAPRAGTSLVEVLMSLLVMGVGVVAVATLFPASVLRSVQATQLTNATTLRYNAEAAIDLDPRLLYDPDFNGSDYAAPPATRAFAIDPWGRYLNGGPLGVGGITLPRHAAGRTASEAEAATYTTQPDSWISEYEKDFIPSATNQTSIPGNPARTTSITIDNNDVTNRRIDLTDLASRIQAGELFRLILWDADGRLSESRVLTYVNGTDPIDSGAREIKFTSSPLPNETRFANIGKVRIERFERRYSWIMTVRRPASASSGAPLTAEVSVAVLFRRSGAANDELAYSLTRSTAGTSTRPEYLVTKFGPNDPNPFIKKGGFLLDTESARWYRIAKVGGTSAAPRVTLDRNPPTSETLRSAVFFRGVIDVFPFSKTVTVP